ncbi:MAG: DUF3787 domain-containing protein [Eubacteriales bacterium]
MKKTKDICEIIPGSHESHMTAAWANIQTLEPESNAPVTPESDVIDAKEWVEENQK